MPGTEVGAVFRIQSMSILKTLRIFTGFYKWYDVAGPDIARIKAVDDEFCSRGRMP
jgi:hypothetical protein